MYYTVFTEKVAELQTFSVGREAEVFQQQALSRIRPTKGYRCLGLDWIEQILDNWLQDSEHNLEVLGSGISFISHGFYKLGN